MAMGGKFKDGFISAAAGHAFPSFQLGDSPFARTVSAGIIGGTASVLGGGKFANGAYTAAFMHLMAEGTRNQDIINRDRVQAKWFYPDGDPAEALGVEGHGINGSNPDSHYQKWADDHRVAVFHIYSEGGPSGMIQDIGEVAIERLFGGIGSEVVSQFISGYSKLPPAARLNISTHSQGVSPVVAAMFRRPDLFRGAHLDARSSSVYAFRIEAATRYSGSTYNWSMPKGSDIANVYSSLNPLRVIHALSNPIKASRNHSEHATEYMRFSQSR